MNMAVPESCTVLVVGGGPGGSYAASVLARDGIDVVLLEADKFPRYHVGESMLPSMRHFLRFIDCDEKFKKHGFAKKIGAAFKINWSQPEAYTDFIAAGGPDGYTWNVVRSEADDILFRHAGECGAKIFDGTKVASIAFKENIHVNGNSNGELPNPGRPVSANWSRKDGSSGLITFDYVIDASGRVGMLSTKYLKNRKMNQTLKNIANWGYWSGAGTYGLESNRAGAPYFEALQDASGWGWFIPLHDGTISVGIVQNQALATTKKQEQGSPSSKDFYLNSLDLIPGIKEICENGGKGVLVSDIKSASDWSYSAPHYAFPYARIVGDAGCFIDPFFSSGVHLAILGGFSAAVTIAAAIKGDCDENTAASWHSKKVTESYTRFFLVVSSTLKQIRSQDAPIISDIDEEGFQRAFDLFRPVIQGTVDADASGRLTQGDISQAIEFCFKAFTHVNAEEKDTIIAKLKSFDLDAESNDENTLAEIEKNLTQEESQVLAVLRGRKMLLEDCFNLESFMVHSIDGLAPRTELGKLGLMKAAAAKLNKSFVFSPKYLESQLTGIRTTALEGEFKEVVQGMA